MILRIIQDEYAENPREDFDQFGSLFITPNRYFSGDNVEDPNDLENVAIQLPVFHYTHGTTFLNTTGFNCPWDSGQCGWIYVTQEKFLREWTLDNVFTRWRAENLLRSQVETYSQYLSGQVYGYEVYNYSECSLGHKHKNIIDSCWGFFGNDPKENGIQENLELPMEDYTIEYA